MSVYDDYRAGRFGNPSTIAANWQQAQRDGTARADSPLTTALAQNMGLTPGGGSAPPATPTPTAPRPRPVFPPSNGLPGFRPRAGTAPVTSSRGVMVTGAGAAPTPPAAPPKTMPSLLRAPGAPAPAGAGAPGLPPPLPRPDFSGIPAAGGAIDSVGAPVSIAAPAAVRAAALPGRIAPTAGLAAAPGRSTLGGEDAENDLERLGRERLAGPVDPGQQFAGTNVSDRVFTDTQLNTLAQQQAEPLLRQLADEEEQLVQAAAAGGGGVDPAALRALRSRAAATTASARGAAMRDAILEGARANAAQGLAAAGSKRADFDSDINARLGLGKLGADVGSELLSAGQQRRGLKQTRDISRYTGDINQRGQELDYSAEGGRQALTARGQDVSQRADDIGYNRAKLDADVTQRGQDVTRGVAEANLNSENRRAGAGLALNREEMLRRLGLEERGQDVSARGQDIDARLGLSRLGNERYGIDTQAAQATADRQQRLTELDRRLNSEQLTEQQRNALERERMQLQRDLFAGEQAGTESRFARNLNEQSRQFDASQQFAGEQSRAGRNFSREMSGYYGSPQQNAADDATRQNNYNNWVRSSTGAFGDATFAGQNQRYVDEILRQLRQLTSAA